MNRSVLACFATAALFTTVAASAARADDFLQQEGDLWRASKLVGVNIYGPDNKKVGDVSDVLMGKDGKATYVVVGVGGFLGIGQKDVAIPLDKVKFTQEPIPTPAPPAGTMAPANPPASGSASMPNNATGLGTPAATDGAGSPAAPAGVAPAAPAAPAMARSTAYPDHGTVEYTVDQLKAAPTFTFAK